MNRLPKPDPAKQRDSSYYEVLIEYDPGVVQGAWADGLRPPSEMKVSEWADRHRYLSQKASAEAGLWRTSRTPYLREIMDALSEHSPCSRVVFMKGAQLGATESGNNWLGYVIDQAPAPIMLVLPTTEMAKRSSRQRIAPLIDESPVLKGKITGTRGDVANTILLKEFPGGTLILTGANSAIGLQSMPARYLFCDEVDSYPAFAGTTDGEAEGDPITMARRRLSTYRGSSKEYLVSTPKRPRNFSRIEKEYNRTDRRRYYVPCPHCAEMQTIEFDRLSWPEGEPERAWLTCVKCDVPIHESHKTEMLAGGEWRATSDAGEPGAIGFHLSALYSPIGWFSWGDAATMYVQAKEDKSIWKDFAQTVLGEPVVEAADTPDWDRLYDRRESYERGAVPKRAVILTAGVDVQRDRVEVEVVGWGRDLESWSVDYIVLPGDPVQDEVWLGLEDLLRKSWDHELGGQLSIARMAIDSGFETQSVYSWVRHMSDPRILAIKGYDRSGQPLGVPTRVDVNWKGKKIKNGVQIWPIGVSHYKVELFSWLRLRPRPDDEPTPKYCHFPEYGEEHFKRLCSEQRVTIAGRGGYDRVEWQQIHPRNEALDCRVYARAAATQLGLERWSDDRWTELEMGIGLVERPEPAPRRSLMNAPRTAGQQRESVLQRRRGIVKAGVKI